MWHASGNTRMRYPKHLLGAHQQAIQDEESIAIARAALSGVGDASLGEWTQRGGLGPTGAHVWHVRRRLSAEEQERTGLHVIDMRNTEQGRARVRSILLAQPQLKRIAVKIGEWA